MMTLCLTITETQAKDFWILPTFELDSGVKLFSTDAVAKYLFPEEGLLRDEVSGVVIFK